VLPARDLLARPVDAVRGHPGAPNLPLAMPSAEVDAGLRRNAPTAALAACRNIRRRPE